MRKPQRLNNGVFAHRAQRAAVCLLFTVCALNAQPPAGPSPALDPAEAVTLQLQALKQGTDAGIAQVFLFASPGNRSQTGPLPRFIRMIREGYPEMLGHTASTLKPTVIQQDEAVQPVELTAADGKVYYYLFLMSRQSEPDCDGCWMTDSVLVQPAESEAPTI